MDREKVIRAGKIASEVREYARGFIIKGMPLIEIANKIEEKMASYGEEVKPSFPTCLSVNHLAAHGTPSYDDERIAEGLLKVDMGVHLDGWISDTAFSIDLENSEENKKIIQASEKALECAISTIKKGVEVGNIGKAVQGAIESLGFNPIVNLCGHQIKHYELHSDISIPNFDNKNSTEIPEGLFAIEPFATPGLGKVKDGQDSGIYILIDGKTPRSDLAREVLAFIAEEYQTLPFCSRWIVKKFGSKALLALRQLVENGNLHSYPELMEASGENVAQTEHTILVERDKITVTTK
ncbi:MAG: type II methionyl aminopeptidase [Candidatus Pacearchaeota archaeon]